MRAFVLELRFCVRGSSPLLSVHRGASEFPAFLSKWGPLCKRPKQPVIPDGQRLTLKGNRGVSQIKQSSLWLLSTHVPYDNTCRLLSHTLDSTEVTKGARSPGKTWRSVKSP